MQPTAYEGAHRSVREWERVYTEDADEVGDEDESAFSGDDSGEDQDEVGEVEVEEEEDGEDDAE
ncbi:MAG: hypothetical protein ACOVQL_10785 [Limnohabitans sp.]